MSIRPTILQQVGLDTPLVSQLFNVVEELVVGVALDASSLGIRLYVKTTGITGAKCVVSDPKNVKTGLEHARNIRGRAGRERTALSWVTSWVKTCGFVRLKKFRRLILLGFRLLATRVGLRIPLSPPRSLGCRETRLDSSENRGKSSQFRNLCFQTGPEKVFHSTP